uniref:DH domain-containing protein n=1 Tax=Poecilia mexicana TaxID=48701 RepID=A0A3B3Z2H5_9TELE
MGLGGDEDEGHHENGVHVVKDSDRQQRLRLCVLNEILNTERDYVRTLLFLQSVSLTFTSLSLSLSRWVLKFTFLCLQQKIQLTMFKIPQSCLLLGFLISLFFIKSINKYPYI